MNNGETRTKVKRMIEGMLYHCSEMSEFLGSHVADEYFETEEGRKMRRYMVGIMTNHVLALTEFMLDGTKNSGEIEKIPKFDFEQMLKDKLS